jgi:hypothetical protein
MVKNKMAGYSISKLKLVRITNCRNDIGREWIDNNNMIYLPLHIVTRNVYSTTSELTS